MGPSISTNGVQPPPLPEYNLKALDPKLLMLSETKFSAGVAPYKEILKAAKAKYETHAHSTTGITAEADPFVYLARESQKTTRNNGSRGFHLEVPKTPNAISPNWVSASMNTYLNNPTSDTSPKVYIPNGMLIHPDIEKLVKANKTRPKTSPIQEIHLQTNYFGSTGVLYLCPVITDNRGIHTINLSRCCITDEGFIALSATLPELPNLRYLDVSYNSKVIGETTLILIQCLFSCPSIKQLVLDDTNIGDTAFATLGLLTAYRSLFYLSVAGNKITQCGCTAFSKSAKPNILQKFNIARNQIGIEGFDVLLNFFSTSRHLRSLNLSKNKILTPWPKVVKFFETNMSLGSLEFVQPNSMAITSEEHGKLLKSLILNYCLWQLSSSDPLHGVIPEMLGENWEARSYFEESKYPFYLAFEVLSLFAGVRDVVRVLKLAFIGLFRRDLGQFFHKKHKRTNALLTTNPQFDL